MILSAAVLTFTASPNKPLRATGGAPPAQEAAETTMAPTQESNEVAIVDFAELARKEAERGQVSTQVQGRVHVHPRRPAPGEPSAGVAGPEEAGLSPAPQVASPNPAASFPGLDDIALDGFRYIPPDTDGAVGPTRIFNTLNNGYRVIDKATGTPISDVSMVGFWSSILPGFNPNSPDFDFVSDPHTLYDPYQNRFITGAIGILQGVPIRLVGVSTSSDPGGTWALYRNSTAPGCGVSGNTACWYDYPVIGFNQTWVVVTENMFSLSNNSFLEVRVETFPYAPMRSGQAITSSRFRVADGGFTLVPVITYSNTETTEYLLDHWISAAATFRLNKITGTESAPSFTRGAVQAHTLVGAWSEVFSPGLPQPPEPGTGTIVEIEPNDSSISPGAVFRDNSIWYAQTIGLPAGGAYTHTAAQWGRMSTTGADLEVRRIDDPTATSSNGGKWYAYPSIAVNANDDVLVGFSQFSSSQFAAAGYAYRKAGDSTTRDPLVYKAGEGFYWKTYGGGRNRWGDYSASQVDPSDDLAIWTVQEYAKTKSAGTGDGKGNWGTWWAKVHPPSGPPSNPAMALDIPPNNSTIAPAFTVAGWAVDLAAPSGTGVDAVHVYAFPWNGSSFGAGIFLGAATLGLSRPDVGAVFGGQFTPSGFSVQASGLALGVYRVVAYAHSTVAGTFNQYQFADVTVASSPAMALDTPTGGSPVQPFLLAGWAVDLAASSGTGVDAVHVWAFPAGGGAPVFVGAPALGGSRPDVGAVFGPQFTNSGYNLTVNGLTKGQQYTLGVYAHSTVTGTFNQARFVTITAQ